MAQTPAERPVEFVINCFERNLDHVTAPGFLAAAVAQQQHAFSLRTLLVNNVENRERAAGLADECVRRGEIDRWLFVEDRVDEALRATGTRRRDFGRYVHWSDCCLVALVLEGPELLCYVDVDLELLGDGDWIEDALDRMSQDPRIEIANPNWRMSDGSSSVAIESDEDGDGWYLGYGFTDQIFLCRRSIFRRRLMPRVIPVVLASPASARYFGWQAPRHSTLFFEQIMDAFMRRKRLLRLTLTNREFEPIPMSAYPACGIIERAAGRFNGEIVRLATWGRTRFGWTDPRVRTTGLLDPEFVPEDA